MKKECPASKHMSKTCDPKFPVRLASIGATQSKTPCLSPSCPLGALSLAQPSASSACCNSLAFEAFGRSGVRAPPPPAFQMAPGSPSCKATWTGNILLRSRMGLWSWASPRGDLLCARLVYPVQLLAKLLHLRSLQLCINVAHVQSITCSLNETHARAENVCQVMRKVML